MLNQIFSFLVLLGIGVLLIFAVATYLHFSLKKQNKQSREEAMKVQTDEPS
jgi:hypothetical protein